MLDKLIDNIHAILGERIPVWSECSDSLRNDWVKSDDDPIFKKTWEHYQELRDFFEGQKSDVDDVYPKTIIKEPKPEFFDLKQSPILNAIWKVI